VSASENNKPSGRALPIVDIRYNFSDVLRDASTAQLITVCSSHNRPVAAIVSIEALKMLAGEPVEASIKAQIIAAAADALSAAEDADKSRPSIGSHRARFRNGQSPS
jgi:prevent-host-death family protein